MSSNTNNNNNIVYICNAMLQNVVIIADAKGKSELDSLPKFKYQQRVLDRSKYDLKNDSVLIGDKIHSNCIIIVDEQGSNNVLKNKDDICTKNAEDTGNLFIKILKQVHLEKEPPNIEEFLLRKRESLQNKLKNATYYFNMKSFHKSSALYKEVLTLIETDMYPDEFMLKDSDILGIKFGYALSKMAIYKPAELLIAVDTLTELKTAYGDEFPTLYYYLARCLFLLEKCQEAKGAIEIGQNILKNMEYLTELNWPGSDTTKMIMQTEKAFLEENFRDLFKECNEFRLPDLKCIFAQCQNKNIFFDNPYFNGYVVVKCSNKCNFNYHRNCWKMKLKIDCIKKSSYFLDSLCATDDCGGIINEILMYDENLHLNTVIIPKTITPPDKNGEKPSTNSNDKFKKKSMTSNENPKLVFALNATGAKGDDCATSFIENKVNLPKMEKKTSFNCYAKEYVPINKKILNSNSNGSSINFHKTDENEGRPNLFDVADLSNQQNKYAPPVNRSEENTVCDDLKYDENSNKTNILLEENSKSTQTSFKRFNNPDAADIIAKLKNEVLLLQSQLFQSEESYNILLGHNSLLQKRLQELLAKPETCDNCTKLENVLKQKENDNAFAMVQLKQLEQSNCELANKLEEVQNSMQVALQEKQAKLLDNENLIHANLILQEKVDDLLNRMKTMSQQYSLVAQNDNGNLRKVMLDQLNCIRHAYASYFTMYENKSKHMIWELEDIKTLSTPDTLPTLSEVDDNLTAWKRALDNSVKSRFLMNAFYEQLFQQFANEVQMNSCPIAIAFPSFIVEPPNIIIRHFKAQIIVNKRLEQELRQQMSAFYKMMSTPYPGAFPQLQIEDAVQQQPPQQHQHQHQHQQNTVHAVLQNNISENIPENGATSVAAAAAAIDLNTTIVSKWDCANVADTKAPNMYDNMMPIGPTSRKITKQSIFSDDDVNSRKENIPNKCDNGTIPKNKIALPSSSKQNISNSKLMPDVVGLESLVNKLHEKLPLVPVNLISRAVNILRERSGGLTGKESKQIIAEIKQILKEISVTEKCLRKSKDIPPEKPVKAWKKVNSGIHWNNEEPDLNCTICFEFMPPEKRMQLRCQHIFHKSCIKMWLQNDSICPICRSFATLDDEFPPLK